MNKPDYQRIYRDLLKMKFPEKEKDCQPFLQKENFSQLDVINLEIILFGKNKMKNFLMMEDIGLTINQQFLRFLTIRKNII